MKWKAKEEMDSNRKLAIIGAVLLITATVTGIAGALLTIGPIVGASDYLSKFSANANQVRAGMLIGLIFAAADASIAIAFYPVLRKYNKGLALGAVGFRLIEGVLYVGSVIIIQLLFTLSQEFVKAGSPVGPSYFQTSGILLTAGYNWLFDVGAILFGSLGAFMYYIVVYRSKLVPRWLSGWGLVGDALAIVGIMGALFGVFGHLSTPIALLGLPILVQEMVFAVWLIVKGFNPSAIASKSD